jgi:hypothetical protein
VTERCDDCGAEIVFGEPHKMKDTRNGVTRMVTQCEECADAFAWAHWPEDWGPYPYPKHKAGNA